MEGNFVPILFGILAVAFFAVFFYFLRTDRTDKKPGTDKKQGTGRKLFAPSVKHAEISGSEEYPPDFSDSVKIAYDDTGSILGMLVALQKKYPDGDISVKLKQAKNYLLNSRYKDYETTLYHYLSDGSDEIKELFARIILKEIGKRMRLPMKDK